MGFELAISLNYAVISIEFPFIPKFGTLMPKIQPFIMYIGKRALKHHTTCYKTSYITLKCDYTEYKTRTTSSIINIMRKRIIENITLTQHQHSIDDNDDMSKLI